MNRRHFFSRLLGAAASVVAGVPVLKAMVPKAKPLVVGPGRIRIGFGDECDGDGFWQEWDGERWVYVQRINGIETRTATVIHPAYADQPHPCRWPGPQTFTMGSATAQTFSFDCSDGFARMLEQRADDIIDIVRHGS